MVFYAEWTSSLPVTATTLVDQVMTLKMAEFLRQKLAVHCTSFFLNRQRDLRVFDP